MKGYNLAQYSNGVKAKLKNRIVAVIDIKDSDDVLIELSIFYKTNHSIRSIHQVRRGSIVDTSIRLRRETAQALSHSIWLYLNKINDNDKRK